MLEALFLQLGAVILYGSLWFIVALKLRRNDIADIAWGIGFILLTLVAWLATSNNSSRAMLMLALVIVWGVRLSLHIGIRNWGKAEDSRYRKWREEWGVRAFSKWFKSSSLQKAEIVLVLYCALRVPRAYWHTVNEMVALLILAFALVAGILPLKAHARWFLNSNYSLVPFYAVLAMPFTFRSLDAGRSSA